MINPFRKSYSEQESALFSFLNSVKLFERLTFDELSLFTPYMFLRTYTQNEAVFFRNDPSQALYVIRNGSVSLNIDLGDKFEVLTLLERGHAFCDNALLENTRRIYTSLVVSERAEIYVLPQINILDIFENHPNIKAEMLNSLAELYNGYTMNLFNAYRSTFGFFDLGQAYLHTSK
jgi:CRP/FNR family transcriptional regulator, cyclic AMP receptor protein